MRIAFGGTGKAVISAVLVQWVFFSAAATAAPAGFGFDPTRLARLDAGIEEAINQGRMSGCIMFVARDGETAYLKSFGMLDIEERRPMPDDAIFRIASMSKALTTTAVMKLYEEGRFRLHDPVAKFIPAFRNPVVAIPTPADSPAGARYATEPARQPISILHLLTHTAGLQEMPSSLRKSANCSPMRATSASRAAKRFSTSAGSRNSTAIGAAAC